MEEQGAPGTYSPRSLLGEKRRARPSTPSIVLLGSHYTFSWTEGGGGEKPEITRRKSFSRGGNSGSPTEGWPSRFESALIVYPSTFQLISCSKWELIICIYPILMVVEMLAEEI